MMLLISLRLRSWLEESRQGLIAIAAYQVVLFLYQLELDSQLQRMLTYENFDSANSIRQERERIERFSGQLQVDKSAEKTEHT